MLLDSSGMHFLGPNSVLWVPFGSAIPRPLAAAFVPSKAARKLLSLTQPLTQPVLQPPAVDLQGPGGPAGAAAAAATQAHHQGPGSHASSISSSSKRLSIQFSGTDCAYISPFGMSLAEYLLRYSLNAAHAA
jgi:hypothetical protein